MSENIENKKELLELGGEELEKVSGGLSAGSNEVMKPHSFCEGYTRGENDYDGITVASACSGCIHLTSRGGLAVCKNGYKLL